MLTSLEFIHANGFLHRDIKPANILVGDPGSRRDGFMGCSRQILMADFGLSRQTPVPLVPMTKEVATLWYRAPEILLDRLDYTAAMDVWSVGVIISELLTGQVRYFAKSEIELLIKLFKEKGTPTPQTFKNFNKYPLLQRLGSILPKFSP
jgi:cyclin-dependent kinase 2